MEELRSKLIELKILLDIQGNSISTFIERLIMKIDNNDRSFVDDILGATKVIDFMHYKAAFLFDKIQDMAKSFENRS